MALWGWKAKKEKLKGGELKGGGACCWYKKAPRKILFKEPSMKWESQEARETKEEEFCEHMCAQQVACLFPSVFSSEIC